MIDQQFDRDYQAAREQLGAGILTLAGKLADSARATFAALHRVQFSAPWAAPRSH